MKIKIAIISLLFFLYAYNAYADNTELSFYKIGEHEITTISPLMIAATSDEDTSEESESKTITHLIEEFMSQTGSQLRIEEENDPENVPPAVIVPKPPILPKPKFTGNQIPETTSLDSQSGYPDISNKMYLGIEHLLKKNWVRNQRPMTYLPSLVNDCSQDGKTIICNSHLIKENRSGRKISYKTKSIITDIEGAGFEIKYRNLVIEDTSQSISQQHDTLNSEDFGDTTLEQEYPIKLGWTKMHILKCNFTSKESIKCMKNAQHIIDITIRNY